MKRDIQCLQQQNSALEVVVASLRSLPEDEAVSLLQSLRGESSVDVVAAALQSNVRLPHSYAPQTLEADFAQQISQSSTADSVVTPTAFPCALSRETSSEDDYEVLVDVKPAQITGSWFSRPQDADFIEHLLNLYFSWVHPIYHIFPRELFLRDMGRGTTEQCSAMLVNAVMALACHYSDRPAARTDPCNPATAGDHFFADAKQLLDRDEKTCLTTIQALGLMATRECSQGRESNAYQYSGRCVRMAVEMGLHLSVAGSGLRLAELEARKITFWGVFNLETACAVSFGRLSLLPRCAADIAKPSLNDRFESLTWHPYHDDVNMTMSPSIQQAARPMLFVDCRSKLSELASDMVNTFYAPRERFTSRRLGAAYAQYQEWHQNLPDAFRLENTALPHVLVLHMYYNACVLHWVLTASTIHLLNLPSDVAANNLSQGMHDLQTISVNHPFAARCIDIIRSLAVKWNITLPEGSNAIPGFRELCTQPMTSPTTAFFAASIPRHQSSEGRTESGSSISSNRQPDTPFDAPPHPPSTFPKYYSDPMAPMDASQAQHAFWTPFPASGVPAVSFHDMSFEYTNSPMDAMQNIQWYAGSGDSTMDPHPGQQMVSGVDMSSTMGSMGPTSGVGVDGADWSWR
ncbi:hypothetical protein LTR35_014351 [Friedmanniomyces endolithicus]|nr:hypothetical protein LTR35_014351 [Friedmanniomyces endolithicus]KAK0294350.1 hypothetical protein LTS00_006940 [Friedmanniomyces endolithicus]KAK1013364.1 hypothetical protein LTR54_004271 [Friedmanniomyces endolithicus]